IERAAHDEHALLVGLLVETATRGDGAYRRQAGPEDHRSGQADFAEHENLFDVGRGKIEIIVRLDLDILRQVAILKKLFEVEGNAFFAAHEETAREVNEIHSVVFQRAVFNSARSRQRFKHGGRTVKSVNSPLHHLSEYEIFF